MLFKELVEHHHVDRFVAHAVNLTFLVVCHHLGDHLFYFLSHQAIHQSSLRVHFLFIMERDRFEGEDHFTGFVHRLDIVLETSRGGFKRAEEAAWQDSNDSCKSSRSGVNVLDIRVKALSSSTGKDALTQKEIEAAVYKPVTGVIADGSVKASVYKVVERSNTHGHVKAAGGHVQERLIPEGVVRVVIGNLVRLETDGSAEAATGDVARKRLKTNRRETAAADVGSERLKANTRVVIRGVGIERLETHGRVAIACEVVGKGSLPQGHVEAAPGVED